MTDKFIVGAGSSYSVGATGGEASHTLTVEELPSHNHNLRYYSSSGGQGHSAMRVGTSTSASDYVTPNSVKTTSTDDVIVNTGGGQAHNNIPPYYALCYIMKISN